MLATLLSGMIVALAAASADPGEGLLRSIDARRDEYGAHARQIWKLAEVGYQEKESSALHQALLKRAGFRVEAGVAGMPTAFVATAGAGKPVIGILAEFDALPGLSQDAVPERRPLVKDGAGHACGHHLFGTGSVAAAIAVAEWLKSSGTPGTVRLYGTPAEEGGGGKVHMVRAKLMDGVDAMLHWHPSDRNVAAPSSSLANISAKFRFHGQSAHASSAPDRGRSALDGVEAMNHMVNMLREHVPASTRIHYVITRGGTAPNVVPELAEVYYYARHPDARTLDGIWDRIVAASEGGARGTGTRVEHERINAVHSVLPNATLSRLTDANLRRVGGVHYDATERAFAAKIRATLLGAELPLGSEAEIRPPVPDSAMGSTDVGDVSWVVPTVGLRTATWVPGTSAHSWQAVAAGGTSIGTKGMMVAAKTLALTAADLFRDPAILAAARADFDRSRGPGFRYQSLLGDRKPPLDYRR